MNQNFNSISIHINFSIKATFDKIVEFVNTINRHSQHYLCVSGTPRIKHRMTT